LQPRGEVDVGKIPNWLAFTPDGKTLFVSNAESNTVTAIDVPTRSVRATITVGRAPKRLLVVPRQAAFLGFLGRSTTPVFQPHDTTSAYPR
jgi:YVTN family beta-propeller protein